MNEKIIKMIELYGEDDNFFGEVSGFSWNMMGQERQFKLKVYPSIGLGAIMPLFLLFRI